MKRSLDVVVPCYNEAECVKLLFDRLAEVLDPVRSLTWRVIYVNDGSRDRTLEEIRELAGQHGADKVRYLSFSRNFGKEAAIFAGLAHSTADYTVLMDADLQHPPEILPKMLDALEEGCDVCGARRVSRKGEPILRSFFSRIFYGLINKVTGMDFVQGGSDFRMMKKAVVQAILSMEERERFSKGIMTWVGFRVRWVEYENIERAAGKTKWSFRGLFGYAVTGFFAFATTPLRIAVWLGFSIDIVTFFCAIRFAYLALHADGPRTGYGTIVTLLAFFGGTIILLLGIIGEYMARIYLEVKKRPIYIIQDTNLPPLNHSGSGAEYQPGRK